MRTHTQNYKNQIKEFGREFDYKITIGDLVLTGEHLTSVTPVVNTELLKSVMKEFDFESILGLPLGETINVEIGLKINDNYEYLNYGNYIIYQVEYNEDTKSYKYVSYDKMLYSMKEYAPLENAIFPMTLQNYTTRICEAIGLVFAGEDFANKDRMIQEDLYVDLGYTYRDVLDEISQAVGGNLIITNDNVVDVKYPTETNDTIDESYFKDVNVKFGEKFGAINTIVLTRSGESDSIYYPETIDVERVEFKIKDNQIMNFNDRVDYIEEIYNKLNGLEFYTNENELVGVCYYEALDLFNISVNGNNYKCILLNDEQKFTSGLSEKIYTDMPEESVTDYEKSDITDRRINEAWLIVKKQESEIEGLVKRVENIGDSTYTKEELNRIIINAETGLTNIFTTSGGNNLLKNTALYFKTDGVFDYWEGNVAKTNINEALSGTAMLLKSGTLKQTVAVPNGTYSIGFNYKRLNPLGTAIVKYNGRTINLTEETGRIETTGEITTNSFEFEINCDVDDSYEIYDLMLNTGEVSTTWSQSQNEIHTTNVNISKNISVEATENDTIGTFGADGVKVINKNTNEVVLKATDTGIETTSIIADSGVIGGVSTKKVGNQSWQVGV